MNEKFDDKFGSIATKVSAATKQQLERILEQMGMNYYQWFQLMAEVTIRIADDRHNLSEQMAKMIQMFQLVPGWKDPVTFCDPNAPAEIQTAIYIVKQQGHKGLKPVKLERGWFDGIWKQTENVQDIVEYIINVCMPTSYKWLRQHMVDLDCTRVFECLMLMADAATINRMDEEIAQMFRDNQRHDYGGVIEYGNRTKQRKHRTPDSLANSQMKIQFDDFDREAADYEVGETEGEHHADRSDMPLGDVKPFTEEP